MATGGGGAGFFLMLGIAMGGGMILSWRLATLMLAYFSSLEMLSVSASLLVNTEGDLVPGNVFIVI